ncbi:hypothetical protein HUJ05_005625 [Dendroctonus ponderosae]|nr:hypothetical protein HUJ05_005625 [Dendroctonus ponderosae]
MDVFCLNLGVEDLEYEFLESATSRQTNNGINVSPLLSSYFGSVSSPVSQSRSLRKLLEKSAGREPHPGRASAFCAADERWPQLGALQELSLAIMY